jgi:hypothetical protein
LPLPNNWHSPIRHAVLNVMGIVRIAMPADHEALVTHGDAKAARLRQLECEAAVPCQELRIKSGRLKRIDLQRQPRCSTTKQMAVPELRAMRGWRKA